LLLAVAAAHQLLACCLLAAWANDSPYGGAII
jgi:hypothetical protein